MEAVAFVTDITSHLSDLNVKLQGRNDTMSDLMSPVCAFQRKLEVFTLDRLSKTFGTNQREKITIRAMLSSWKSWLKISKTTLRTSALENKFYCALKTHSLSEMSHNSRWKHRGSAPGLIQLFCKLNWLTSKKTCLCRKLTVTLSLSGQKTVLAEDAPRLQKMTPHILTTFASAYRCESAFSTMNTVKNSYRSRLTNEHHQRLRVVITPVVPKFKDLVTQRRSHFSH